MSRLRTSRLLVVFVSLILGAGACSFSEPDETVSGAGQSAPSEPPTRVAPSEPPTRVCEQRLPGPDAAPEGAVSIDPDIDNDLATKTIASPPGTTFWLAPGTHTLGIDEFGQITPKDGNVYIGGPGAVLDGRGINRFAFTQRARDVEIRHLTVQGFVPPQNQGVVNHDSGDGWIIEHNTIQDNSGAGLMAGAGQQVRYNCLRSNGQYGMNAYQAGDGITGLVVEFNEIVGNNTADWERQIPGCGCTGGVKFWSVNGADIRSNWIHDNRGAGLWADTNNNDFVIDGNLIEDNDAEAVFYETSYNLVLQYNTLRSNAIVKGNQFAERGDSFPVAAIYLSEAGGDPRVPARNDLIDIHSNKLEDNWSGITAWENADRFCNSPADTSTGYCTRLVSAPEQCSTPDIADSPLYDDCRWKTQRLSVHENEFSLDPAVIGCPAGHTGRMALLSNYGTFPDWSPYQETVVQTAITFDQDNRWWNNIYNGPWTFMPFDTGQFLTAGQWQADPYLQDPGSMFANSSTTGC